MLQCLAAGHRSQERRLRTWFAATRRYVPLVVASHSLHQLLIVTDDDVSDETAARVAQRRYLAVVSNHDVAVLADREREALRRSHIASMVAVAA